MKPLPPRGVGIVALDFETYYGDDYTLSSMTTEEYVRDPRFEGIGVGVVADGVKKWLTTDEFRAWAPKLRSAGVLAHHAHFDGLILNHHFGVKPAFWFDTLSMARFVHGTEVGNSLKKLAEHYGLGVKGEEVLQARNKRRADFSLADWVQYGNYCINDCDLALALFWKMADAFSDLELWCIDATVRMFTEPQVTLDTPKLAAALKGEQARKAELLLRSKVDKTVLNSNPKFAELLMSYGVDPPTKLSPTTGEETFAFAKSDPGFQELLDSPNEDVRLFAEARVGIKSTIDESRLGRLLGMSRRGPATVYLKYSGAHTHRWSGGDKTNFQNLRRGGVLRDSLIAPEGKVIVACDSAAIEARGLAWLAGDADLMADFRVNADVYSKFASEIYGRPIDRKRKVGDTYPDFTEGFVGKTCILGLGYGMGWRKFALTMLAGPMGSKPIQFTENDARTMSVHVGNFEATNREAVQSITSRLEYGPLLVHCAVAKAIVDKYRRLRQPITKFWKEADQLIAAMASEITPQGYIAEFGEARFQVSRHAIKLPSGNVLKYDGLEGDDIEGYSYRTGFNRSKHSKIYGGSFTENLVQAFCRDIIAEQMIVLQAEHGYRPITMTHDEIVFLADESEALAAEKIAVTVMSTPPDWCSTLPLSAEAGSGKTYGET